MTSFDRPGGNPLKETLGWSIWYDRYREEVRTLFTTRRGYQPMYALEFPTRTRTIVTASSYEYRYRYSKGKCFNVRL